MLKHTALAYQRRAQLFEQDKAALISSLVSFMATYGFNAVMDLVKVIQEKKEPTMEDISALHDLVQPPESYFWPGGESPPGETDIIEVPQKAKTAHSQFVESIGMMALSFLLRYGADAFKAIVEMVKGLKGKDVTMDEITGLRDLVKPPETYFE